MATPPSPGVVDAGKLAQVEAICREFLDSRAPVYAQDVPLAQAKAINGLRAVFGEVRGVFLFLKNLFFFCPARARRLGR